MSDYTPTRQSVRAVYVGAFDIDPNDEGKDAAEAFHGESFDRFIAKVKADELREAANDLMRDAGLTPMALEHPAVRTLHERADRIEEEA